MIGPLLANGRIETFVIHFYGVYLAQCGLPQLESGIWWDSAVVSIRLRSSLITLYCKYVQNGDTSTCPTLRTRESSFQRLIRNLSAAFQLGHFLFANSASIRQKILPFIRIRRMVIKLFATI